jgi:hypothetical protein
MTKSSLTPDQRRTVEIIEALRFGVIERLSIRGGIPCYETDPHIVQAIKLDSDTPGDAGHCHADLTLKREFDNLFHELAGLSDALVDVEIRHGLPVRLVLERSFQELK